MPSSHSILGQGVDSSPPTLGSRARLPLEALGNRNLRVYLLGQSISQPGSWMQNVALAWLVLDLTGSPAELGVLAVFQFAPELVGSPMAGVVVDRLDKRRLLFVSVVFQALQAAVLAALAFMGTTQLWHVYALALVFGITTTFSVPAGQAMVGRLVEHRHLQQAVSLNQALMNASRIVGPGLGGIILATWGDSWCFALNALSFVPLLAAVASLDMTRFADRHRPATGNVLRQLADGVRYATRTPALRLAFGLLAFMGAAHGQLAAVVYANGAGLGATRRVPGRLLLAQHDDVPAWQPPRRPRPHAGARIMADHGHLAY